MRCFIDSSNKTRDIQATPEMISKIFLDLGKADGKNLLLYSNHDELVHSFFPRQILERVYGLAPDSGNTVFFYWVLLLFHRSKIICLEDIFLHKRYLKTSKRVAWNHEYHEVGFKNPFKYVKKAAKDVYNTLVVYRVSKDLGLFLRILLLPIKQIEKGGGFHGLTRKNAPQYHLGTLPSLLLSPFFEIYKLLKK